MKMKHILLASLLSVGILSVTQSAQAFKPGSPAELKAEVKVERKVEVFMYLGENDEPIGYEFQVLDPDVSDAFFELMDQAGISRESDPDDDTTASAAAKKKKVKTVSKSWCEKHPKKCNGSDPNNGGSGYWTTTPIVINGGSYTDPVNDGSNDQKLDKDKKKWSPGTY